MRAQRVADYITAIVVILAFVGCLVGSANADSAGGGALALALCFPLILWVLFNGALAFVHLVSSSASDVIADGVRKSKEK